MTPLNIKYPPSAPPSASIAQNRQIYYLPFPLFLTQSKHRNGAVSGSIRRPSSIEPGSFGGRKGDDLGSIQGLFFSPPKVINLFDSITYNFSLLQNRCLCAYSSKSVCIGVPP